MDFRYALRSMGKNPGFTILAVVVMGLGIGANTAVFSVVNSVLLKPLDYHDPDRIVTIRTYWKKTGKGLQVSGPDFHDLHDQSTAFSAMAYYFGYETAVNPGNSAEYASIAGVTAEFPQVFELRPELGRTFTADEMKPGSSGAVMISDGYWRSHFAADPGALGRTIRVGGKALPIVGVMPERFHFPGKTDLWLPANALFTETVSRSAHNYRIVARLKPGVAMGEAQSQLTAIAGRLEALYPNSNQDKSMLAEQMRDMIVKDVRTTLYVLLGAVALVLLIACANVANLLLAKATGRAREMAIRAAVGASRGRIVRLLASESLLLAGLAGALGVTFAIWGAHALVALAPADIPRLQETSIDGSVLVFTMAASLFSCLLFGLAPALHASKVDLNDALKQGATRVMGGGAGRMRSALVVAEIALSVVLVAGAGLLIRSFLALQVVELGFHPERVLVMPSAVPAGGPNGVRREREFYKRLLAEARSMPGVLAVGVTRMPPGDVASNGGYWIDHLPENPSVASPQAVFTIASDGMLAALGIPLRRGRDIDERDTADAPYTALINEALAKKSFPGQDPIGREIYCGFDSMKPMKIVGVIGDVRQFGPARDAWPEIVMPYGQHGFGVSDMNVLVRTAAEPTAMAEALRRKAREISPDVPVKFTTMETLMAENVGAPRFRTILFGVFAGVALCLAMAGVYGVMAYVVGQRMNELGLRVALGASPGDIMGLVMRQGLWMALIGVGVGLAVSVAATQLLQKMLFGVKPFDPLTYGAVAAILIGVALAATYLPARRATRVDPLVALRQE
jgi:putative ABC transport system permease protein